MLKKLLILLVILAGVFGIVWSWQNFYRNEKPQSDAKITAQQKDEVAEIFKVIDGENWAPWRKNDFFAVVPFALQETSEDGQNYQVYHLSDPRKNGIILSLIVGEMTELPANEWLADLYGTAPGFSEIIINGITWEKTGSSACQDYCYEYLTTVHKGKYYAFAYPVVDGKEDARFLPGSYELVENVLLQLNLKK